VSRLDGETKVLTATRLLELLRDERKRTAELEAALRAIREAHDANTPHHEALEKIDRIARAVLRKNG
jgi:hypothetical protein